MPITQDRLISLIETIDGIDNRFRALRAFIERQRQAANRITNLDEMFELYSQLMNATLNTIQFSPQEYEAFVREREHFKFSAAKNRSTAKNIKRYREREKIRRETILSDNYINNLFKSSEISLGPLTPSDEPQPSTKMPAARKPRDPILDEMNMDLLHTMLVKLQDELPETLTASDFADIFRSRGGTEEEAMRWLDKFKEEGLVVEGKFPGEIIIQ